MQNNPKLLWQNAFELSKWLDHNCMSCRWRLVDPDTPDNHQPCTVPADALQDLLTSSPTSDRIRNIVCGPPTQQNPPRPFQLPNHCRRRKDNRGRPAKKDTAS